MCEEDREIKPHSNSAGDKKLMNRDELHGVKLMVSTQVCVPHGGMGSEATNIEKPGPLISYNLFTTIVHNHSDPSVRPASSITALTLMSLHF